MDKIKVSKKALQSLVNDSLREALGGLELPKPNKKVDKLIDKSAQKLAGEFVRILKKEHKEKRKSEKALAKVDHALQGKKVKKEKKVKKTAKKKAKVDNV